LGCFITDSEIPNHTGAINAAADTLRVVFAHSYGWDSSNMGFHWGYHVMALTPYSPHPNLTGKIAADKIIMRKQVSSFSKNLQVLSLPIFKLLSFTSPFLKVQT
jgi:hypothetical protein